MIWVTIGGGGGGSRQVAKTSKNVQKSARWSNRQHFAVRCKKENITPTSIKLHSNVKGVSEHFWWYYWLSSNWCHMIQKGHVTPTATSYHPLTKAERFCRKFRNFFNHYLTLCVECFIRNVGVVFWNFLSRRVPCWQKFQSVLRTSKFEISKKKTKKFWNFHSHRALCQWKRKTFVKIQKFKILKNRKIGLEIWWIAIFPQNLAFILLTVSEKTQIADSRTDDDGQHPISVCYYLWLWTKLKNC